MSLQANNQDPDPFLSMMVTETQRSFENPVILLTMKDFAERMFESLVQMHTAFLEQAPPMRVVDILATFHFDWLQAVQEVETFKNRIRDTPREHISKAIEFTIDCVKHRHDALYKYIGAMKKPNNSLEDDLKFLEDVLENHIAALNEKQKIHSTVSDSMEFYHRIFDESEELLNWLDLLNDNLALQYSKVLGYKNPNLSENLSEKLRQIVDQVAFTSPNQEVKQIAKEYEEKTKHLCTLFHLEYHDDVQINEILETINGLLGRINRLQKENSPAAMALRHKTLYLEDRILSLENLNISLNALKNNNKTENDNLRIFDHFLPAHERCRLVQFLMQLWNDAVYGFNSNHNRITSNISIVSAENLVKDFTNKIGIFTIDECGRKMHKGSDKRLCQLDDINELVCVNYDSKESVDFYGIYSVNEKEQHKSHDSANEYNLHYKGLFKMREFQGGHEIFYGTLGRYMIDETGKRIYTVRTGECYEHDSLGNLVRIRSKSTELINNFESPVDVVTEESKYLQRTVGLALKKCIADVVLHQPSDPIQYLADRLEHYRKAELRQTRREDVEEMMAEREARRREANQYEASTAPASLADSGEEDIDPNYITYQTMTIND